MATNLSNIGFNCTSASELEALARKCFANGRATRCAQGIYIRWEVATSIELWAQLSLSEELMGLNPHFFGNTRISVGLMQRITREGLPLDGGFKSYGQPYGNGPIRGAFTFVFDCPDFHVHEPLELPTIASVQMTAFAQQCRVFANEEDFAAQASRSATRLSATAFVPTGLFGPQREQLPQPLASAIIAGHVLDSAALTNPFSKQKFHWAKLRNALGELDLVADPELLPQLPRPRSILQSSVWLSGRIQD